MGRPGKKQQPSRSNDGPAPKAARKSTAPRVTRDGLLSMIEKHQGNLAAIAKDLNVTRQTVYNHINSDPDLSVALRDSRERATDFVENALYAKALKGDTTAMIFWLKCMGRDRGWIEQRDYAPPPAESDDDRAFREAAERIYTELDKGRKLRLDE